jgi:hypothetical protein
LVLLSVADRNPNGTERCRVRKIISSADHGLVLL